MHHRKIELQTPADFTYLYGNCVALSRQKLDLHLPPSATSEDDGPDPMRERVRDLVDEFINRTFTTASSSISINGIDSSSEQFPFPAAFTAPTETVEYEPYDTRLAARVTALYAQIESLTTTVAQMRRDAPARGAEMYAEELRKAIEADERDEEQELFFNDEYDEGEEEVADEVGEEGTRGEQPQQEQEQQQQQSGGEDVEMADGVENNPNEDEKKNKKKTSRRKQASQSRWNLDIPLGTTEQEAERWRSGQMAGVYEDALRTLLRLQGEEEGEEGDSISDETTDRALTSTVGKSERAGRAVEVVERM